MKKTQVMHWRHLKRFADLEDTLLLFRSGNFCRTFEEDAVFLSCVCGFQILVK
ncbi:MAG: hypothetical protein LBD11_01575 [Candidatus Peribacteria bacterium]|nr:hypothetical protein [Candidatus Peribacteria bacterium]